MIQTILKILQYTNIHTQPICKKPPVFIADPQRSKPFFLRSASLPGGKCKSVSGRAISPGNWSIWIWDKQSPGEIGQIDFKTGLPPGEFGKTNPGQACTRGN